MVEDTEIESAMKKEQAASKITDCLVNAALKNGGKDNITVIVVIPEIKNEGFWKRVMGSAG